MTQLYNIYILKFYFVAFIKFYKTLCWDNDISEACTCHNLTYESTNSQVYQASCILQGCKLGSVYLEQ